MGLDHGDRVSHPADIVNRMLGARKYSGSLASGCAMRVHLAGNNHQNAGARRRRAEERTASPVAREPALMYGESSSNFSIASLEDDGSNHHDEPKHGGRRESDTRLQYMVILSRL